MSEPKILVLVLAIDKNPWKKMESEGQEPTWMRHRPENIEIFRYTGVSSHSAFWRFLDKAWAWNQKIYDYNHGKFALFSINNMIKKTEFPSSIIDYDGAQIKTNVPDLYSLIGKKTLDAFETSIKELDFDYIYRTNVSSYVDLQKLNKFIQNKPLNNYYAGAIGNHQGISFASGCGYFISRDLVVRILKNKELWNHDLIDDVSVGKLITKNFEIKIEEVTRIDIDSVESVSRKLRNRHHETFHYRCKATNAGSTIEIMTQIDNMLVKENKK